MTSGFTTVFRLVTAACLADGASLSVYPQIVHAGEKASVTWETEPGTKVTWLGNGPIQSSGRQQVTPTRTSTIPFLFEIKGRVEFRSATIEVVGLKGSRSLPVREDYEHSFSASVSGIAFTVLCQKAIGQLQKSLGFDLPTVFADLNPDGSVHSLYFQTNWRRLANLQTNLERGVKERLITYLLRLDNPVVSTKPIAYELRMKIENRLASDEIGEIEKDQDVYDRARQILLIPLFGKP